MLVDDFVRNLISSGLIPAPEVHDYLDTFPAEKRPRDGESLAHEMIRDKHLNKFQAARILAGKPESLVFREYAVLSKIGAGGMGQVFKARHPRMERVAAIKVLPPEAMKSPDLVKRFQQEVRVAAKLNHPNIVATYDAGEQDGVQFLIMEYVPGRDLASVVKAQGPMPVAQAVDCILQAARGLDYAHSMGVIHRDIKPSNLLLATDGTIKVLDMGLARIEEPAEDLPPGATLAERLTQRGQMLGTVDYISPEQASDTRSADHRSDIYALGCTLYRLVTAHSMYEGKTAIAKLMCHYEAAIPSMREAAEQASPELERVFQTMVSKRPEDRYQSMQEVIAALERCLQIEEDILKDTVTLTPTSGEDEDCSPPGDRTLVQPTHCESDADSSPSGDAEPTRQRPATVVATGDRERLPLSEQTVKEQTTQKTLTEVGRPEVRAERKTASSEATEPRGLNPADQGASTSPTATHTSTVQAQSVAPSLTTKFLIVALVGGIVGALAASGLLYLLLR